MPGRAAHAALASECPTFLEGLPLLGFQRRDSFDEKPGLLTLTPADQVLNQVQRKCERSQQGIRRGLDQPSGVSGGGKPRKDDVADLVTQRAQPGRARFWLSQGRRILEPTMLMS
jgi:hypothetical protein